LGTVTLKGSDGRRLHGDLISLNVGLSTANHSILVRFVVCKHFSHACLLLLNYYRRLLQQGMDVDVRHDDYCRLMYKAYGHGDDAYNLRLRSTKTAGI